MNCGLKKVRMRVIQERVQILHKLFQRNITSLSSGVLLEMTVNASMNSLKSCAIRGIDLNEDCYSFGICSPDHSNFH